MIAPVSDLAAEAEARTIRAEWPGAGVPVAAAGACFAIIILGGLLAELVPAAWAGNWAAHVVRGQTHFVDRFFPFDAVWYQRIATEGYVWDPTHPDVKQDVAFFPLWPMLLRLAAWVSGSALQAQWCAVAMAAGFGLAGIAAFHRLALRLLPMRAARTATWLFALYPGASFLLLSYPTGLMNLLCVLALLAMMDRRFFAAALWCGLVTAIGPLGLGASLALCTIIGWPLLTGAEGGARRWMAAAGICAVSVSGLAAFLAWQWIALGDAFAFIKAQGAWAQPLPWLARIPHAAVQLMVIPDFVAALHDVGHALRVHGRVAVQAALEQGLHRAWLGVALIAVAASARLRCRPVLLQGAFTMALFIWFHSVSRPGNSALRLTYCTIAIFLGLAWLLQDRPVAARVVIAMFALMLGCGAFLSAAGYHVV
jgi:hypothetical protein